jgi:hypothetical protein
MRDPGRGVPSISCAAKKPLGVRRPWRVLLRAGIQKKHETLQLIVKIVITDFQ